MLLSKITITNTHNPNLINVEKTLSLDLLEQPVSLLAAITFKM